MHNSHDIKLIDCTLRDGGYYNNWEFEPDFVHAYIKQCILIRVDVIELGYIRLANTTCGPYGNLTSGNLKDLNILLNNVGETAFAVMINAQEMFNYEAKEVAEKIQNICGSGADLVKYIRIAVQYKDILKCLSYIEVLQKHGFNLCLSIMQIELASAEELTVCIHSLKTGYNLSAIYIADSFGSFLPNKLQQVIELFQRQISSPLGFHGHNNQGLAIANSLNAINNDVKWIDVTMYGMGRGAGNTQTEQFLPLVKPYIDKTVLTQLYEFIINFVQPLKDQYQWGANALYGVAGIERIHPLYVQVPEQLHINKQRIISALKQLPHENSQRFSHEFLDSLLTI